MSEITRVRKETAEQVLELQVLLAGEAGQPSKINIYSLAIQRLLNETRRKLKRK